MYVFIHSTMYVTLHNYLIQHTTQIFNSRRSVLQIKQLFGCNIGIKGKRTSNDEWWTNGVELGFFFVTQIWPRTLPFQTKSKILRGGPSASLMKDATSKSTCLSAKCCHEIVNFGQFRGFTYTHTQHMHAYPLFGHSRILALRAAFFL